MPAVQGLRAFLCAWTDRPGRSRQSRLGAAPARQSFPWGGLLYERSRSQNCSVPWGESGLNDLNLVFIDRDQVLFEVLASGVDEDTARLYWAAEKEKKPRER